jgi:hypothetical protein
MGSTPSTSTRSPLWGAVRDRGPQWAGWLALAALLILALPLFLCMPLCNDVTLYDLAARNVLRGGTHYRDIFDTNLPGMVWLHLALRGLLGWSWPVLRLVDFFVVCGIAGLLVRWLRPLGMEGAAAVWWIVLVFVFYLSTSELVHCQRDVWMLLPALGGMWLRQRQLEELAGSTPAPLRLAIRGMGEGLCWGTAFWIKPFVVVPAVGCWLTSLLLARGMARARFLALDGACLLTGGLFIGGAGVVWLLASGTWPYLWDVVTTWNTQYVTHGAILGPERLRYLLGNWLPWSLLHLPSLPLTMIALLRAGVGEPRARTAEAVRRESLLGAVYLGWLLQVILFQKNFEYVQAPLILLALGVLAGRVRLLRHSSFVWWGLLLFLAVAVAHSPLFRPDRLAVWARCWCEGGTAEVRDRLKLTYALYPQMYQELEPVADYLRSRGVGDGELTCWNNSPHVLYLYLDVQPASPYLQMDTVLIVFPGKEELIRWQLQTSRQRFVVSDLQSVLGFTEAAHAEQPGQPLALPPGFPLEWQKCFPWSEPVVFRSGRYLVHEVTHPLGPLLPKFAVGPRALLPVGPGGPLTVPAASAATEPAATLGIQPRGVLP